MSRQKVILLDPKLDIEQIYQEYLRLVQLDESQMHEIQRSETRRAFFGGMSQFMALLIDYVTTFPNDIADEMTDCVFQQLSDFWEDEAANRSKDEVQDKVILSILRKGSIGES